MRADPEKRFRHYGVCTALSVLIAAVFAQVAGHDFVDFDDLRYVVENPMMREPFSAELLLRMLQPIEAHWVPLTWLSLYVDYQLYGPDPAAYLRTNVAMHAAGSVLLFVALGRLTGRFWESAFVAALFAVHPLHVESVAWASERKDVLSGFFFAASLLAYAHYTERPSKIRYGVLATSFGLGLLAKPMLVTLPCLLLLLDWWPLGRIGHGEGMARRLGRAAAEKLPLFAMATLASVAVYHAQSTQGGMELANGVGAGERIANALVSYAWYLAKAVWPSGLAAFYPHSSAMPPLWQPITAGAALFAVSIGALRATNRRPHLFVGWAWFLGSLVPVIGLVQIGMQSRADRFMYIPLIGLGIALAWEISSWSRGSVQRRWVSTAACVAAVAALAIAAHVQVRTWSDTITLFTRVLEVTPDTAYAHHRLAEAHRASGRIDAAEHHLQETVRIGLDWSHPSFQLAQLLEEQGRDDEALGFYRKGLALEPGNGLALERAGHVSLRLGRAPEATSLFDTALEAGRDGALLRGAYGLALIEVGDQKAAVAQLRVAERLGAGPRVVNNLAWILATTPDAALRNPDEAARAATTALARIPAADAALLDTLAAAFAAMGRYAEAAVTAEQAKDVATERGMPHIAKEIEARLAGYQASAKTFTETGG